MRLGGCMCPQRYCLTGKRLVSLSFIVDVGREAQSADRPVALQPASGCLVARVLGLGRLSAGIRMSAAGLTVPVALRTWPYTSLPWPGS
jgi:hypothetical protein